MSETQVKPRRRNGTVMIVIGAVVTLFALMSSDGGMALSTPIFLGGIILMVGGFILRRLP